MWARVKGQTENALFQLPFKAAYAFRPASYPALERIVPKTAWLRAFYAVVAPLYPLWKALFPRHVTTTACIGRAMIHVARAGAPQACSGESGHQRDLRRRKVTPPVPRS